MTFIFLIEIELILKNLLKFTNYSVEVVPFTQKGDGVPSRPIYCLTDQDGKS